MAKTYTERTPRRWTTMVTATLLAAGSLSGFGARAAVGATTWAGATAPLGGVSPAVNTDPNVNFGAVISGDSSVPVACPTTTWCVAVGNYDDVTGHPQGLIETFSGGTWTAATAPLGTLNPAAGSDPSVYFYALSCATIGSCVATGSYVDASSNQDGLIETLAGGTWTATTAPTSGLSSPPATAAFVTLTGLSCTSASSCVAVGTYLGSASRLSGVIETLAGGTWTATTAPLTGLSTPTTPYAQLFDVSCPAAGSCVAVGQYQDGSNGYEGLIETLANGAWTATTAPLSGLNPASSGPTVELVDLACPLATFCVAVGFYAALAGNQGLIETFANGAWTATTAPLSGLNPAASDPPIDPLAIVSCPSDTDCTITGSYDDTSGNQQGLIETLANGTWSASSAPVGGLNPASDPTVSFSGQSCDAVGSCVAVGSYVDASGYQQGLIETLANGTWSASSAPVGTLSPPAGTNPTATLDGVSCPGTGTCVAVGSYVDASGYKWGLVESSLTTTSTTCTWTDGGGGANDWSNGANWSGTGCTSSGGPPPGASLVFPPNIPNNASPTNDLTAGTVFDSLTIEDGYTLTGNAITLDPASGTGITATGTAAVAISTPIILGASQTFSATNTAVHLNGIVSDAGKDYGLTLSGYLWDVHPLAPGGPGSNTYGGGTVLSGNGCTSLATDEGLGSGPVTITSGSTLLVASGVMLANPITVSGSGAGGNGAIEQGGGVAGSTLSGPVTLASNTTVLSAYAGQSLSFAGGINGAYQLVINQNSSDLGAVTIAAASTYTGGTTVTSGILDVADAHALGSGPVDVASGATLEESSVAGITVGNALTLNGAGATSAGATGALEALSGTDGWSGPISLGSATTVATGAPAAALLLDAGLSGTGPLTIGAPANEPGGTVELLNAATYSGATVISTNATARIASATALSHGAVTIDRGGELQVDSVTTLANALQIAGTGTGVAGAAPAGALEWFGADLSLTQPLTLNGSASVVNLGNDGHTLTLAGGVNGTGALSTVGTVVLPTDETASNTLGLAALAGALRVDGAVTSSVGATDATVNGTGSAAGIGVGCGATLAAGDGAPGVVHSSAGLSLVCANAATTLEVTIDGTSPGSGYSQIAVSAGNVNLNNVSLTVTYAGGFTSSTGDVFDIIANQGGAVNGVLTAGGTQLSEGSTFTVAGRTLKVSYVGGASGHDVTLTDITSPPPPPPSAPQPVTTATTTTLTSSTDPATTGQLVTYVASVSPIPSGGSVTFTENGSVIAGCAVLSVDPTTGQTMCHVTYPSANSPTVDANYSGNATYRSSSAPPLTETVNAPAATVTTVTVTPASVTVGRMVTYEVQVTSDSGTPNGTVRFAIGGITLCSATLANGSGDCRTTATSIGTHTVTGAYSGDPTHAGSSGATTVVVRRVERHPRTWRLVGPIWAGRSTIVRVLGRDLYGRPVVTTDTTGTTAVVLADSGRSLTLRVTVTPSVPRGVHTMTFVFARGQRSTVRYRQQ